MVRPFCTAFAAMASESDVKAGPPATTCFFSGPNLDPAFKSRQVPTSRAVAVKEIGLFECAVFLKFGEVAMAGRRNLARPPANLLLIAFSTGAVLFRSAL